MKVKYDHYSLYPLLSNGEEVLIEHEGVTYKFQFQGNKIGSESFLLVTHPTGEKKKFGWGWNGEQIMRALDHLEKGWNTEQFPVFRLYNNGHLVAQGGSSQRELHLLPKAIKSQFQTILNGVGIRSIQVCSQNFLSKILAKT